MASRLVAAPGISPSNVFTINYNDEGHDDDGDEGNDAESTGDYSLSSRVRLNKANLASLVRQNRYIVFWDRLNVCTLLVV